MKKTLLALALLLGTGGAFAQIGIKADAIQKTQKTTLDKTAVLQELKYQKQQNNLNGRKDGETKHLLCDFSDASGYDFVFGPLDGTNYGWYRADMTGLGSHGTQASAFFDINIARDGGYWFWNRTSRYDISPSAENGFAFLSWLDIEQAGLNTSNNEAIIKFNQPIESYGMRGVDIWLNQVGYRFNRERYYIDWSNDANFSTYDSIEFNIRGLEVDGNSLIIGTKRVTLPRGTYNANSVAENEGQQTYVRIRAYSPANADQPQGYAWLVDDIYYSEVPEDRIDIVSSIYYREAYHLIPVGVMTDTIVHVTSAENTGGTIYNDIVSKNVINTVTFDENDNATYTYYGVNASTGDTLANKMTRIIETDNAGVPTDTTEQRYVDIYAFSNILPYQQEGRYSISTILTNGEETVKELGDTIYFNVVGQMENNEGHYRWAKDRNAIAKPPTSGSTEYSGGTFTYGFVRENGYNYITDKAATGLAGYEVCLPYGTNNENTSVKYITGIEVVPAVDSCRAGAKIQGKLRMFNTRDTQVTYDNMIIDVEDEWGVPVQSPVYTVQDADLNKGNEVWQMEEDGWGLAYSNNFSTIYLEFPNSVRLEPGQIYYACYRMAATGKFAVATDRYLRSFGPGGGYIYSSMLIFQSTIPSNYAWGGSLYQPSSTNYSTPMIRMILGDVASLPEEISSSSSLNAYPNPANGETTISYSLNKSGNVNIVITDMMGRTVKMMNQGNQVAGTSYNVNLSTSDLANGTYFYTLSVNGEKQTKKLVVNK